MSNNPKELYGDLFTEELELEDYYKDLARAAAEKTINKAVEESTAAVTKVGQKIVGHGFEDAYRNVETWWNDTMRPKKGSKAAYIFILRELEEIYGLKDPERGPQNRQRLLNMLTLIPLTALINSLGHDSIILSNLSHVVAAELQEEARLEAFIKTIPERKINALVKGMSERVAQHYKVYYARQTMQKEGFTWSKWDKKISLHLAFQLLELVIDGTGYFERYHEDTSAMKGILQVAPTDWLLRTWSKNTDKYLQNIIRNCPMVIPPKPWEGLRDGGYYGSLAGRHTLLRADSLRYSGNPNVFTRQYLERLEEVDISQVKAAINRIQETPWRINKEVFEVLEAIIARGGEIANVPRMTPLDQLPDLQGEYTEEQLKQHKKEKWRIYKEDITRKTLALRALAHFNIAKKYKEYDKIYFPHNMDFRGRVYPIPMFGPQGDDINKGLLLFADPPACSSRDDIDWLMIHGANLAGVDKVSFSERKHWVRDHEEQILASAADPLGFLWWAEQDDCPFQLLAFCFEWSRWKLWNKTHGTPKGFVTGIPIAFDGTCSGLQHYSAILRDPVGGAAVNLVPGDTPNDIYRVVSDKVNEILKRNAMNGTADEEKETDEGKRYIKYGTKSLAQQWLAYGVNRKVTKRSVMTLPYGSREFGFREQILVDTIQPAIRDGRGGMFVAPLQASSYMATLIWITVQEVVVKAVEGMAYLQKVARVVCKKGRVITWTTPMGLPVQQAYMEERTEKVKLWLQDGIRRWVYSSSPTGNVSKHEQVSGIAPNFIHSMDAAHLQLTVLNCYEKGIHHFALIHDSYGAPVAQAGLLFKTVRESFLQMYTQHDVLADFMNEMIVYLEEGDKFPKAPKKGKLNLEVILESPYMFA